VEDAGPEAAGTGRVRVRLAGTENGARTLLPSEPVYASYLIEFTGPAAAPNPGPLTKPPAEMAAGFAINVPEGNWNIVVTGQARITGVAGIEDGLYAAASGSKEVTATPGGEVTAEIDLRYLADAGEGVFTYTVTLPSYSRSATLTLLSAAGAPLNPPVSFNLKSASTGTVYLASGYYLVQAAVEGYGDDKAVRTEILHIYRGLTTALDLRPDFEFIKNTVIDPTAAAASYSLTDTLAVPAADVPMPQAITQTAWYSGQVSWSPAGDGGYFGFGKAYTADLKLIPKPGTTFGAPGANAFSHTGAQSVSRTLNDDGTVTVTLRFAATEGLDPTAAHDEGQSAAGLYIGARGTPKGGVSSLSAAFAWIAANAVENGKYRYVLGEGASQAAKVLDGAAFGNKAGVVITLAGGDAEKTIQLSGTGQMFRVSGGTLRLGANVTLAGVAANSGGALAKVESGGTLIMETGSKISGNTNTVAYGEAGGVLVAGAGAKFVMNGGEISGNTARYGGGVIVYTSGTFVMTGGEITGNTAKVASGSGSDANGGGVWLGGQGAAFVMSGGSINGNKAQSGGGVYGNGGDGTFTMSGSAVIEDNEATAGGTGTAGPTPPAYSGGGVYVRGTFVMKDTAVIKGNTAAGKGGGVYIVNTGAIDKTGGTINGSEAGEGANSATGGGPAVYIDTAAPFARKTSLTTRLTKAAANTAALPFQDNTGAIAINSVTADGDAGNVSTQLAFVFGGAVTGLTAAHITLPSGITVGDVSGSGTSWTVAITTIMRGTVSVAVDLPGVTVNPVYNVQIHNPNVKAKPTLTRVGGTSALEDSTALKVVFNRNLEGDALAASHLALTSDTSGEVTLGAVTQDLTADPSGMTYLVALATVVKEGSITLTFTHDGISTADSDNVKTVGVFKNADHTAAHAAASAAGLYAGNMAAPVQFTTAPADNGAALLDASFGWIAANARENGKYRIVLGADFNQAATELNAAAFNSKSGVVITLAGDTQERIIQLTGTGSLFTVNNGTLRLDNYITLKGVSTNILALLEIGGTLIMETGSKITGNTNTINWGNGGGVWLKNSGTPQFTMNGGIISGNSARQGGGVMVSNGAFTMTGGEISGNTAPLPGGSGMSQGGGIWLNNVTFSMSGDAVISGNKAKQGGGIYQNGSSGEISMSGDAVIKGNLATNTSTGLTGNSTYDGGGVYLKGKFTKTGGTIYGDSANGNSNTADGNGKAVYGDESHKRDNDVTDDLSKDGATYTGTWN
jgi:hypothetical protein